MIFVKLIESVHKGDIEMKDGKWIFLLLATLGAIFMVLIGFSIGAESIFGLIISILGVIVVFGLGFTQKKKMREKGLL